jgi:hypothetical protein
MSKYLPNRQPATTLGRQVERMGACAWEDASN